MLYDLAAVDPMYQFSLDAYVDPFLLSIKNAPASTRRLPDERIKFLNEFHTYATYMGTPAAVFSKRTNCCCRCRCASASYRATGR